MNPADMLHIYIYTYVCVYIPCKSAHPFPGVVLKHPVFCVGSILARCTVYRCSALVFFFGSCAAPKITTGVRENTVKKA